uniref:RNA helicase n=1 Tax=Noctiluca scintillans TaxID=2966 RepID=A0A7S1FJI5_NOCSC
MQGFPNMGMSPEMMMQLWQAQRMQQEQLWQPGQQGMSGTGMCMPGSSWSGPEHLEDHSKNMPQEAFESSQQSLPSLMNGATGGGPANFPSMEDLNKNASAGGGSIVEDTEVKVIDPQQKQVVNVLRYTSFDEAPFPPTLQESLRNAGFPAPSQIQQYTWPLSVQNLDVIGVAATGSGKTLAFLLPAFSVMLQKQVRAGDITLLVIAPTRELAVQIQSESDKFGKPSGLKTTCVYGGAPKGPQADYIRSGVHGVIGTPGRINDFLEGGQLRLGKVEKLVLDEADRMLDMGFEPQIRKILQQVPRSRHTMFFTATWPNNVRRLASEFLNHPHQIQIGNRDELKGNQDITQMVKIVPGANKQSVLREILQQAGVTDRSNGGAKGLVFCSTKKMCDQLSTQLDRSGVPCNAIHGDKDQRAREHALNGLKTGSIKLLVATDVAARGLDIKGVTLVVNFDAPSNTEDYVHRIGRTGRAGTKGYAVSLITDRDAHALRGIIQVMKRTNQVVTPEMEEMASRAPPKGKGKGRDDGGGKGGSFGSFGGTSVGGYGAPSSFVADPDRGDRDRDRGDRDRTRRSRSRDRDRRDRDRDRRDRSRDREREREDRDEKGREDKDLDRDIKCREESAEGKEKDAIVDIPKVSRSKSHGEKDVQSPDRAQRFASISNERKVKASPEDAVKEAGSEAREIRETRDVRDGRDTRDTRDRDTRDSRKARDTRDTRDTRDRDARDREPREERERGKEKEKERGGDRSKRRSRSKRRERSHSKRRQRSRSKRRERSPSRRRRKSASRSRRRRHRSVS